jgi:Gram-negative bacterial TonB protein C-terminal
VGNTDSYVVWDAPGQPCSILLNLELVDALQRWVQTKPSRVSGVLLGRHSISDLKRTLVTIEDCDLEAGKIETAGGLSAVGVVSATETAADPSHVLLIVRRVANDVPLAKLVWRGESTEMPLDSTHLKSGGFTILHGRGPAKPPIRKQPSNWRKWAWVPLAAGMALWAIVLFWPERKPEEPPAAEVATSAATVPPPVALPKAQERVAPKPVPRRQRNPPPSGTVTVDYRPAPESTRRGIFGRLRRLQIRGDSDFVPAKPFRETKPSVPAETARRFPGEWRVDLRLSIDKSGQVSHVGVLGPSADSELVGLARAAASRWEFHPARLRDRPVSSVLDLTFRFRNPATKSKS